MFDFEAITKIAESMEKMAKHVEEIERNTDETVAFLGALLLANPDNLTPELIAAARELVTARLHPAAELLDKESDAAPLQYPGA